MRNTFVGKIVGFIASALKTTTPESAMAIFSLMVISSGTTGFLMIIVAMFKAMVTCQTVDYAGITMVIGGISAYVGVAFAGKHYAGKYENERVNNNNNNNNNGKVEDTSGSNQ